MTKTDLELLEAAAKAAGIACDWHHGCGDALHLTAPDATAIFWNPLHDDGDALRLAVKLGITVQRGIHSDRVFVGINDELANERLGADPYEATRRAIVRAAAAISENK